MGISLQAILFFSKKFKMKFGTSFFPLEADLLKKNEEFPRNKKSPVAA